jgi:GH24 family phage-related lysozyme (muramidase)
MVLSMSPTGLASLTKDEGAIDGLYDDPSGYGTFGVGHLVHPADKWGCFLLAAAQAMDTCRGKLAKTLGVTYLPRSAVSWGELSQVKAKATEIGIGTVGRKKFNKEPGKLGEAEKATALGIVNGAVRVEVHLLAATVSDVLAADLRRYESAVHTAITGVRLDHDEFDALVSLAFNIGVSNFKGSTLVRLINENKYRHAKDVAVRNAAIAAIANAFASWNKSGGVPLAGLTRRRKSEADRFLRAARAEAAELRLKPQGVRP